VSDTTEDEKRTKAGNKIDLKMWQFENLKMVFTATINKEHFQIIKLSN